MALDASADTNLDVMIKFDALHSLKQRHLLSTEIVRLYEQFLSDRNLNAEFKEYMQDNIDPMNLDVDMLDGWNSSQGHS